MMDDIHWRLFCKWLSRQEVGKAICVSCGECKVWDNGSVVKISKGVTSYDEAIKVVTDIMEKQPSKNQILPKVWR